MTEACRYKKKKTMNRPRELGLPTFADEKPSSEYLKQSIEACSCVPCRRSAVNAVCLSNFLWGLIKYSNSILLMAISPALDHLHVMCLAECSGKHLPHINNN